MRVPRRKSAAPHPHRRRRHPRRTKARETRSSRMSRRCGTRSWRAARGRTCRCRAPTRTVGPRSFSSGINTVCLRVKPLLKTKHCSNKNSASATKPRSWRVARGRTCRCRAPKKTVGPRSSSSAANTVYLRVKPLLKTKRCSNKNSASATKPRNWCAARGRTCRCRAPTRTVGPRASSSGVKRSTGHTQTHDKNNNTNDHTKNHPHHLTTIEGVRTTSHTRRIPIWGQHGMSQGQTATQDQKQLGLKVLCSY